MSLNSEYEAAVVGFGKDIADKAAEYSILEGWNPAALAGGSNEECTRAQYTAFAEYLFDVLYGDR